MPTGDRTDIDGKAPPFDQLRAIRRLEADRTGKGSGGHARHSLYAAYDSGSRTNVLIKVTSKPGVVYEQNLSNEIATLRTIDRELPASRYFPVIRADGRLRDGRIYLITSLFDEFPLAIDIGTERRPERMVAHLRTAIEVARSLAELHRLGIFHVDLNPMNILHRVELDRPVIRIVDFESSYETARHSKGLFYDPPTTPGYSAPEVTRQAPDGRADVFSLGAVLYTMLAGYGWTWADEVGPCVEADRELDPALRKVLRSAVHASPAKRYPSMHAFQSALGAYLEAIWPGRSW